VLTLAGNVGLQSLNQPAEEGMLKRAPHQEIDNVLLGEVCLSRGVIDTCFRHQNEYVESI
jgi:hypothetical protein